MEYEVIIIGGGIAGLQAAIQLGRAQRSALVIDSNQGRSNLCRTYHNILGWPDGVSGEQLRKLGRQQAESVGIQFMEDTVISAEKGDHIFRVKTKQGSALEAKRILIATGILDRIPDMPEIYQCLGSSVYICPDCDGYEIKDQLTLVAGSGNPGANMALTLSYWTDRLIYINHEQKKVDSRIMKKLKEKNIQYIHIPIKEAIVEKGDFTGFQLADGRLLSAGKCFLAFGGNEVRSGIAKQLGVEVLENNHIKVNRRTQETNVKGVWAAGDVTVHSEQTAIAMGDGLQAAIWIHKSLLQEK
ncbi:NAD(P)/FAD-dependent oxidoreductase [Peribacillus kribbensis]|uniref:NAD(P)/FAD-dependent oxidoreductase n=1 Tax=Peribacillus kribbensis TaxID=356658 RepID=UPI0004295470|nr:NAD(P)/FAD-dependent oxidoreductase [Peribacillus kribbensis]